MQGKQLNKNLCLTNSLWSAL